MISIGVVITAVIYLVLRSNIDSKIQKIMEIETVGMFTIQLIVGIQMSYACAQKHVGGFSMYPVNP